MVGNQHQAVTIEEVYAKHHRTPTRPNPFLSPSTQRAMEEWAEVRCKELELRHNELLQAWKNASPDLSKHLDTIAQLQEDMHKAYIHLDLVIYGNPVKYMTYHQNARGFIEYLRSTYIEKFNAPGGDKPEKE